METWTAKDESVLMEQTPVFLMACSGEKSLIKRQCANLTLLIGGQLLSANLKQTMCDLPS